MNPKIPTRYSVLKEPCSSCPYRRDTPPGIWDASEYERLLMFRSDDPEELPALGVFLCHHTPFLTETIVCRGWLTVEADSIAVRLLQIRGCISPAQVNAKVSAPLYSSGKEAALAGLQGVRRPSAAARRVIEKLQERKRARCSNDT